MVWGGGAGLAESLAKMALVLWAIGSVLVGVRVVRTVMDVQRMLKWGSAPPEGLKQRIEGVASRLGVRVPRIVLVEGLSTPVIWAVGRPTLLWPDERTWLMGGSGEQAVIAHELAHLKRRDHWTAWLDVLAACALWWHPLAILARRNLRAHAELACDAWAVWAMPGERKAYAQALIEAAAGRAWSIRPGLALGVMDSRKRSLYRRLHMIVGGKASRRAHPLVAACGLVVLAAVLPTWAGEARRMTSGEASESAPPIDAGAARAVRAAELMRRSEILASEKQLEEAIATLREAMAIRPARASELQQAAYALMAAKKYAEADEFFGLMEATGEEPGRAAYNRACAAALAGDASGALAHLDRSVRAGFEVAKHASKDEDLDSIRKSEQFAELMHLSEAIEKDRQAAERASKVGEHAGAAEAWTRIAARTPGDAEAFSKLGYALAYAGRPADAEAAFARQAQLEQEPATAIYNQACCAALAGEKDRAFALLERAYAAGFENVSALREDQDLKSLREDPRFGALSARITRPMRLVREAEVAREFEDWAEAASKYEEALVQEGLSPSARKRAEMGLAETRMRSGNAKGAAETYVRMAAAHREPAKNLYNAGRALALAGEHEMALAYLNAAVEAGFAEDRQMMTDDDLKALREYKEFLEVVTRAQDRNALGLFRAIDWEHVRHRSEQRLERNAKDGPALLQLGWAQLRMQETSAAAETFTRMAEVGHMPGMAHYNVACCQALLGKKAEAIRHLEQSMSYGFGEPDRVLHDPDLASLRGEPAFEALIEKMKKQGDADADHEEEHASEAHEHGAKASAGGG